MTTETCDRCGTTDISVSAYRGCQECGPVPLCGECRRIHIQERLDESSVMDR